MPLTTLKFSRPLDPFALRTPLSSTGTDALVPTWVADFTTLATPAGLTFARSTDGGYIDIAGNPQIAGPNVARFDYDPVSHALRGLLMEPQVTNFLLNSTAPATQTVTLGTGTFTLWILGTGSVAVAANTAVGTGFGSASAGTPVTFTISTGGTVDVTVTGTPTRFQLENSAVPTSFIVTVGSTVTRTRDELTGAMFAGFNASEGTLVVEVMPRIAANGYPIYLNIGTSSNESINIMNGASGTSGNSRTGNVNVGITQVTPAVTPLVTFKHAFAYKQDDFASSRNGGTVVTDTAGALPTGLTTTWIGSRVTVEQLNGWVRKITYYNQRLPNATLQELTQ